MRRIVLDIPDKACWIDLRMYDQNGEELTHTPMIDTRCCDMITLDNGYRLYTDKVGDDGCGSGA